MIFVCFQSESALREVAKVLVEASSVTEDSSMIDKLISNAIIKSSLVVEDLKQLEEGLNLASAQIGQNIDRKIAEADWMLSEVVNKTFDMSHNSSKQELEDARRLYERINQFKEPAFNAKKQINETIENVVNVIKLLSELMNKSHDSLRTIVKAEELNSQTLNRHFDQEINSLNTGNEEVLDLINKAKENLDGTKKAMTSYESISVDMERSSERLAQDRIKFNDFMDNNQKQAIEIRPKVISAQSHALTLKRQSDSLDRLFSDTRNKANNPMRAANAYNSIIETINNSSISAQNAFDSAKKAEEVPVSIFGTLTQTKVKSSDLVTDSQKQKRKIESELENQLKRAVLRTTDIENQLMVSKTNGTLINEELKRLPEMKNIQELGTKASSAADLADSAAKKSEGNIGVLALRIDEIKKNSEKVNQDLSDRKDDIRLSHSYIEHISDSKFTDFNKIEEMKNKYEKLRTMREGFKDKISQLQRKIDLARHQANRIKVTAEFGRDSSLELNTPESLSESATHTKLSLFFRTNEENALLAYIGNPTAIKQKQKTKRSEGSEDEVEEDQTSSSSQNVISRDFMSLELESGNVVINWDLGTGTSAPIRNEKFVSDWRWHQVVVERIGKSIKMTVRSQNELDSIVEGTTNGPSSVFNLDPQNTHIFIGGIPDNIQVQSAVQSKRFTGFIEEVVLGDNPLGLWNFRESTNVIGAKEREQLVDLDSSDGLYFDGSGYAVLSRGRLNLTKETYITLKFKTFAREGLLFLIGQERDFLALEMREGLVIFKYELGSGPYVLTSNETFNDGKWHSILANRFEKEGAISVDGILLTHGEAIGLSTELSTTDDIYIGGFPDQHQFYEVTNIDFEGCIKDLQIGTEQQNLQNLKEVLRAVPGCPSSSGRTASFTNESTGYIAIESDLNLDRNVQITLNFKTVSPKGLLFYVSNKDHSSHLAIYLEDGTLGLRVQPGGSIRTEDRTYNDKQWHYITATFTPERLRLDVDDVNSFTIETTEKNELTLGPTKTIYFGGIPPEISSEPNFPSGIPTTFVGCFGDATVNERFQNFADTNNRPNASLTSCPLTDQKAAEFDKPDGHLKPITDKPEPNIEVTSRATPVTRRPTKQPPIGQCKLPPIPNRDMTTPVDNSVRFGDTHWSRHEFPISSEVANGLTDESGFQIEFKTTHEEGVIFYVTSVNNIDYVSLYLIEGKVHYAWDCGSGRALIVSERTYNDDKWHKVTFSRKGRNGIMRIDDGKDENTAVSNGNTNSLNVKSPIFIGGIPEELSKLAKNNLRGVDKIGSMPSFVVTSFPGCLRELSVHANPYRFGAQSVGYNVSDCTPNVESGSFFHSDGGHIRLYEEFRVGSQFFVNLEIKPRTLSGVLLAVFGQTDYLMIYLDDGKLTFIVDNGAVSHLLSLKIYLIN